MLSKKFGNLYHESVVIKKYIIKKEEQNGSYKALCRN